MTTAVDFTDLDMRAREVPCAPLAGRPWPVTVAYRELAGDLQISAATLTMITKKNLPMRAIFFRDHEISGLWPCFCGQVGQRPLGSVVDAHGQDPA
jgi:hypothetical protein